MLHHTPPSVCSTPHTTSFHVVHAIQYLTPALHFSCSTPYDTPDPHYKSVPHFTFSTPHHTPYTLSTPSICSTHDTPYTCQHLSHIYTTLHTLPTLHAISLIYYFSQLKKVTQISQATQFHTNVTNLHSVTINMLYSRTSHF